MVVYAMALSYADVRTLLCTSVWGFNEMLKICDKYRFENNIIFVRKQFVLNLEVLLLRGNLHVFDGVILG